MQHSLIARVRRSSLGNSLWWLLPLAFVAILLLFFPFRFVFEFNPDEGLHLMRSLLHLRGYELYGDVYNDQPPVFTLMLSALFSLLGLHATFGRLLVLLLSSALMAAALAHLQEEWGAPHAVGAWLLFLLLPKYPELSVSVMISLPSVALAMISFYSLVRWHRTRSTPWLILSAVALALSVMIKVFTGLLVPLFAAGLLLSEASRIPSGTWRQKLAPSIIWLLVFAGLVGVIALVAVGPANLAQLIQVHLSARESEEYLRQVETHNINYVLRDARGILLLAFAGALVALRRRQWTAMYLAAWAALAYGGLSFVLPVWAHHQLLVTVPALMLAAIFLGETARGVKRHLTSFKGVDRELALHALAALGAVAILGSRVSPFLSELSLRLPNLRYTVRARDVRQYEILALMWKHADRTELVVTDRPMYAFRIEKPVPPQLAVISEKRLWSGSITQDQIVETIRDRRPEQVLLVRFPLERVQDHLEQHYEAIYHLGEWRLYLRNDLVE